MYRYDILGVNDNGVHDMSPLIGMGEENEKDPLLLPKWCKKRKFGPYQINNKRFNSIFIYVSRVDRNLTGFYSKQNK